jgi:hypothetical protein
MQSFPDQHTVLLENKDTGQEIRIKQRPLIFAGYRRIVPTPLISSVLPFSIRRALYHDIRKLQEFNFHIASMPPFLRH